MIRTCIHFVGFQGEEYWSAVRIWGQPDFIHRIHDRRAYREMGEGDVVVFANKEREDFVHLRNAPDITGPGYDPVKDA